MYNVQPQYAQFSILSGTSKRERKYEATDKQTSADKCMGE